MSNIQELKNEMILLDNNLSPRLCTELGDIYPGITHVSELALEREADIVVWRYAKEQDLHIMTKDKDFIALLNQNGHPPKVICLQLGNCTNKELQSIIRSKETAIKHFMNSSKGILKIKR